MFEKSGAYVHSWVAEGRAYKLPGSYTVLYDTLLIDADIVAPTKLRFHLDSGNSLVLYGDSGLVSRFKRVVE
ncbi:hypothetical protein GCM10023184_03910 [Flaviaesturariibacter amylovorans]|uniref:Uncharacterized protein n=1 Tax=Flaviaesturariibacter amylovorans TaxID=1084520 RepID=A0ABP8G8Q2_9BACT